MLSNADRRTQYDRFGTLDPDLASDSDFFSDFESMFFSAGMGGGFDDMDEFTAFLEKDTKFMSKMMRDLGKGARVRVGGGKRRKQGGGGMEEMLNFFMMPEMMMGMGGLGGKKKGKKQKKKEEEDDGWGTEEEEIDDEDGVKKGKDDGGWETVSEDDEK